MRAAWTEPMPVRSAYGPVWSLRTPSLTGCCATAEAVSPTPHNRSASVAIMLRRMKILPLALATAECRSSWHDGTGQGHYRKVGRGLLLPLPCVGAAWQRQGGIGTPRRNLAARQKSDFRLSCRATP